MQGGTARPRFQRLGGPWGDLLGRSLEQWTVRVEEDVLLGGFRNRPGIQPWIGEHAGKWLLGALGALEFPNLPAVRDGRLEEKIGRVVDGLIRCQEADGYLGTYEPGDRFREGLEPRDFAASGWDVWVHKYVILALLAYHRRFGDDRALAAAVRAGDLLARRYGPGGPGDLNRSDWHVGLASGSVLEAVVLLYRASGEPRHLSLADRIVTDFWERDGNPRIMPVLRDRGPVSAIGRGKAYEMMSCFVGLLEYAQARRSHDLVDLVRAARDRIGDTMRHVTGGVSSGEWFLPPGQIPEHECIETCVTFTWIQLNLRLHDLCGDEWSLELAEEAAWNQLLPALGPDGSTWTYHLPITGPKRFARRWLQGVEARLPGPSLTCCHTNGQRGLALFPLHAFATGDDGAVALNFFLDSAGVVVVPRAGAVEVSQESSRADGSRIVVRLEAEREGVPFPVAIRHPHWASSLRINGRPARCREQGCRVLVPCRGSARLELEFEITPRVLAAGLEGRGKYAVCRGPLVYALDSPPSDWGLDGTALVLDRRDPAAGLKAVEGPAWDEIEADAVRIPARSCWPVKWPADRPIERSSRKVLLLPVLAAGIRGNRSVTEEFTESQIGHGLNNPAIALPEYRTLLPVEWEPATMKLPGSSSR